MLSVHSFLIYTRKGVRFYLMKELRKRLFFVLLGLFLTSGAISAVYFYFEQKALRAEIGALDSEYYHLNQEMTQLKEHYNTVSQIHNERQNIFRIITSINHRLSDEKIVFWVKMLQINADGIYYNLNEHSFRKLESPLSAGTLAEQSHYSLNPGVSLLLALAALESDYNLEARSQKGAYGPMQLRKIAAEHVGLLSHTDPEDNINGGVKYLNDLLRKYYSYPDQLELALASYNAGRTRVSKEWIPNWGGSWQSIKAGLRTNSSSFRETRYYVNSILALTQMFVSGKWNSHKQQFWNNYKYIVRNIDLTYLYGNTLDSIPFH